MDCTKGARWENWEGNETCVADVYNAATLDDLKAIVQTAARERKTIRASGGGRGTPYSASFSVSPIVTNNSGIIVKMSGMNKAFVHEDGSGKITAEAGMTMAEFEAFAAANGLALESSPVPPFIEVGGGVALGCHGTGRLCGTLSDQVVGMEILTADGSVKTISQAENPELMKAARVNVGTLGLMHRVTFQCVKQFKLEVVDETVPEESAIRNIQSLVEKNEYLEVFWFPFVDAVSLKKSHKVPWETPNQGVPGALGDQFQKMQTALGAFLLGQVVKRPHWTPALMRLFMSQQHKGKMVGPASAAFHYQRYFPRQLWDMSYAIDVGPQFENFHSAWAFVKNKVCEYAKAQGDCNSGRASSFPPDAMFPQNFIMHARFITHSDAYLAPSVNNKLTCMLQVVSAIGTNIGSFFDEVEQHCLSLGARPHWGKTFNPDLDFRKIYGDNLTQFDGIRNEIDPSGMFLNDFMRKVFRH